MNDEFLRCSFITMVSEAFTSDREGPLYSAIEEFMLSDDTDNAVTNCHKYDYDSASDEDLALIDDFCAISPQYNSIYDGDYRKFMRRTLYVVLKKYGKAVSRPDDGSGIEYVIGCFAKHLEASTDHPQINAAREALHFTVLASNTFLPPHMHVVFHTPVCAEDMLCILSLADNETGSFVYSIPYVSPFSLSVMKQVLQNLYDYCASKPIDPMFLGRMSIPKRIDKMLEAALQGIPSSFLTQKGQAVLQWVTTAQSLVKELRSSLPECTKSESVVAKQRRALSSLLNTMYVVYHDSEYLGGSILPYLIGSVVGGEIRVGIVSRSNDGLVYSHLSVEGNYKLDKIQTIRDQLKLGE